MCSNIDTKCILSLCKLKLIIYVQLVPENGAIKFFDSIDMDKVYKKDGQIEGFYDVPVTITGK